MPPTQKDCQSDHEAADPSVVVAAVAAAAALVAGSSVEDCSRYMYKFSPAHLHF